MGSGPAIGERVATLVADFPECPAVLADGTRHCWGELGASGTAVACALADADLGTGARVGLLTRERPATVAALIGLLQADRHVVLLNGQLTAREVLERYDELHLGALVADERDWEQGDLWEAAGRRGLTVEVLGTAHARVGGATSNEQETGTGAPTITVMTSGTTGPPKPIAVPFELLDEVRGGREPGDPRSARGAIINALPLSSVGGVLAIATSVWTGRPLALMDRFDVVEWAALVEEHQPRRTGGPPAVLRMVLDAGIPPVVFDGVTCFETGSAPLDPALADEFEATYGVPVLPAYGATEFLAAVAGWSLEDHARWSAQKRGSVGRPFEGVEVRIVDDDGAELPAGEPGRLDVLPRSRPGQRDRVWTSTNDRALLDGDGFLFVLGRLDDVIVRGGFKVPAGEVERILRDHPSVVDAAVVGLADERLGEVPVAAVVLVPGETTTEAELIAWSKEHLTPYKVPVRVTVVIELPRNSMMKVSGPAVRALFGAEASR